MARKGQHQCSRCARPTPRKRLLTLPGDRQWCRACVDKYLPVKARAEALKQSH